MSEFVKVATLDELGPGQRKIIDFDYDTVAIFNIDGQVYAIADICTHDGEPLADGLLDGYQIICPRHGACFDVRSGAVTCPPAVVPVPAYAVKIEGRDIYLESPDVGW